MAQKIVKVWLPQEFVEYGRGVAVRQQRSLSSLFANYIATALRGQALEDQQVPAVADEPPVDAGR